MKDIQAVVYDMDGVLIDSEPLWRKTIIEVFAQYDIALTHDQCRETTGLRVDEVVRHYLKTMGGSLAYTQDVEVGIWKGIIEAVGTEGKAMEGVHESLEHFSERGLLIALASTSRMILIDTVLDALELRPFFSVVHSAEHEHFGKPHPAVYLTTLQTLGVVPAKSVAIEDSVNGVIAAKAARMHCIAIPEPEARGDRRYGIADHLVESLHEVPALVTED